MRGVLRVTLTLALAGICSGYFLAEKQVTLADDGHTRRVRTFAPTVGAALWRMNLDVGPSDRVRPGPDSPLPPRIEVRRAKDVVLVLNGYRREQRVTGQTVSEVMRELELETEGAFMHPPPQETVSRGEEIVVSLPVRVTIEHDGTSQEVRTNALTAGAVLRQAGVALGPSDRVEPSIVASPAEGSVIKVVRVKEVMESTTSPIPFRRVTEKSDQLELGLKKVRVSGQEGVRSRSYRVLYENGRKVSRTYVGTKVVRQPRDEVTLIGTKRPVINLTSHSQVGKASWFGAPGLTAAHRTLPMGTVVKVTNLANGRQVTVVIRDRGPYIEGRIIDLSDTAFREIASANTGVIPVKIEW